MPDLAELLSAEAERLGRIEPPPFSELRSRARRQRRRRGYGAGLAAAAVVAAAWAAPGLLSGAEGGTAAVIAGLPDRSDPAVHREEQRLAELLTAQTWIESDPACTVRLLRHEGKTSWGWAECRSLGPGVSQGNSVPFRVDGDTVSAPDLEVDYGAKIKELFPADLAALVLEAPPEIKPPPPQRTDRG